MTAGNRVAWVDLCKGLAIILVVLGHTLRNDISLVYIYGFHMPLFFFLSGIVFNEKKYSWTGFLKSRFNSLIIPYIFFYLITWLYWLFVERSFRPIDLSWWQPLIGMFYGAQWKGLMDHNGILWFLPCLFSVEVIYYAICRLPKTLCRFVAILIVSLIGINIYYPIPWCINVAMGAVQFFFLGHICKGVLLQGEGLMAKNVIPALLLTCVYILLQFNFGNEVNIATSQYGPSWVYEICAIIGIFAFVSLSKTISISKIIKRGGRLGRNTLVIFALHQPVLRIVKFVGSKMFTSFPIETNMLYALLATGVVILALVPVIWCYNYFNKKCLSKLYVK